MRVGWLLAGVCLWCACNTGELLGSEDSSLRRVRVALVVSGDPASGPYSVEAQVVARTDVFVEFYDLERLIRTEDDAPYCLTPEQDGACLPALLGAGRHVLVAKLYRTQDRVLLAQDRREVIEGGS